MKPVLSKSCAAVLLVLASMGAAQAGTLHEPGAMLRDGTWDDWVGSFVAPQAFSKLKPSAWPTTEWYRLTLKIDHMESAAVTSPTGESPAFLRGIVRQLEAAQAKQSGQAQAVEQLESGSAAVMTPVASQTEPSGDIYLRVPGTQLRTGVLPVYRFKNGTPMIRPQLDYRYALKLGEQDFAFTVRNGLRTKSGAPYGDGAQVTIEYDGQQYEYSLGQFGWDSTIAAIADLDGDGKPDFIISVGGNNSGFEAVLLSSKAKPGKNPPTASLTQSGC